jgi:hypothetical protein
MDGASQNLSYTNMQKRIGRWVTLITARLSHTNCLSGMQYLKGMSIQAKMFAGAM